MTRLIGQYTDQGEVKVRRSRRHRVRARYERKDIELLALVDEAHDTLRGPARQKVLDREFHEFADSKYETLSSISVAHICNLRKRREYRERRMTFEKTRPTRISSGERLGPEPEGRAGYLRIDTVHQGNLDGVKGVYHINAVDEVTQMAGGGSHGTKPGSMADTRPGGHPGSSFLFKFEAFTQIKAASSSTTQSPNC